MKTIKFALGKTQQNQRDMIEEVRYHSLHYLKVEERKINYYNHVFFIYFHYDDAIAMMRLLNFIFF